MVETRLTKQHCQTDKPAAHIMRINYGACVVENDPSSAPDDAVKVKYNGRWVHFDHTEERRTLSCSIDALLGGCRIISGRHIMTRALDMLPCRPVSNRGERAPPTAGAPAGGRGGIRAGDSGRAEARERITRCGTHREGGAGHPSSKTRVLRVDRCGAPTGMRGSVSRTRAEMAQGRERTRQKNWAGIGRSGGKTRPGSAVAPGLGAKVGAARMQPVRSPRGPAGYPDCPKSRAVNCGDGGRPPDRAVPGRNLLRFLVLRALAGDGAASLQGIAAGIAITRLGMGAATLDAYLPGGPRRELDKNIELAAGDMARAGLVQLGPGGRMQVTAGGNALLDKMGEMYGGAGYADARAPDGRAGEWEAEPAISDRLLRHLSPAYKEWQDGGQVASVAHRGTRGAAKVSNGIVASIDMLGTTNERAEHDEMELHEKWTGFVTFAKSLFHTRDGFDVRAESDTIKIVGNGHDTETLLKLFGRSSWRIVVRSIEIDMPVRGCVAAGKYCTGNEDLVTGEAVREAKAWYEYADWIGIMAAPSAGVELDKMEKADRGGCDSMHGYYTRYDVPSKTEVVSAWAVNWPRQCEATYGNAKTKEMDQIMGDTLKKLGLDAGRKWRNAKEFCDASRRSWVPYR